MYRYNRATPARHGRPCYKGRPGKVTRNGLQPRGVVYKDSDSNTVYIVREDRDACRSIGRVYRIVDIGY